MGNLTNSAKLIEKIGGLNVTKVGASAPSNPVEGNLWYDTTNDVLKSYDGTNWNVVGDDTSINTKIFYLSSTSDLTTAQAAYDWIVAGKEPIIVYSHSIYTYNPTKSSATARKFYDVRDSENYEANKSYIGHYALTLQVSDGNVTSISRSTLSSASFLDPDRNYSTPYIPQYDGSPATKKYVDDKSATVMTEAQYGQVSDPIAGKIYFIKQS